MLGTYAPYLCEASPGCPNLPGATTGFACSQGAKKIGTNFKSCKSHDLTKSYDLTPSAQIAARSRLAEESFHRWLAMQKLSAIETKSAGEETSALHLQGPFSSGRPRCVSRKKLRLRLLIEILKSKDQEKPTLFSSHASARSISPLSWNHFYESHHTTREA